MISNELRGHLHGSINVEINWSHPSFYTVKINHSAIVIVSMVTRLYPPAASHCTTKYGGNRILQTWKQNTCFLWTPLNNRRVKYLMNWDQLIHSDVTLYSQVSPCGSLPGGRPVWRAWTGSGPYNPTLEACWWESLLEKRTHTHTHTHTDSSSTSYIHIHWQCFPHMHFTCVVLVLGGMTKNVYQGIFSKFQQFHCIWRYFFSMHNQVFTTFSTGWQRNY